jgi:hypothetical protein
MTNRLRPAIGDDKAAWTRDVFAAGDYAGAAMFGDASTWQWHAARAMLGVEGEHDAALANWRAPEATLHRAAARWMAGDEAVARRLLAGLDLPQARRFLDLLDRERIQVLAQLPWLRDVPTDLLGGIRHDPRFDVRNIGPGDGDVSSDPYDRVGRHLADGFTPDFYLSAMMEWHHLPPDLDTLPCPRFAAIADHDLHIQTIQPWLDLFDELCVTDRSEWLDVQGLGRGTVSSCPFVFGLPDLPPIPAGDRHLDFFVSGTMLDPWHPDKARLLHELLAMPDIDLRVLRGFVGPMAYHAMLAASKVSFTYVRRPGAMPTRGLEALAFGCGLALQQDSVLHLWFGSEHGVVPYGTERGDLAGAVRQLLDGWRDFGPAALRGAQRVRSLFPLHRTASRYFRFLTFRAAMARAPLPAVDTSRWCQKRLCVSRTWLPADPMVRRRTMQANFRHLGEVLRRLPQAVTAPTTIVDMARELLCEFAFYAGKDAELGERRFFDDALGLLANAMHLWPRHLATVFLRVRALLAHGDAEQRQLGLQLAREAIAVDATNWQLDAADDVMPFDFLGDAFHYRDYFDLLAREAKGEAALTLPRIRLVLAALTATVARADDDVRLHERAVALDPSFDRYRLDLAQCLRRTGGAVGHERALALFTELADGSGEFAAAAMAIAQHWPATLADHRSRVLATVLERFDGATLDTSLQAKSLFAMAPSAAPLVAGPTVSVLVPFAGSSLTASELVVELSRQTIAADLELIVACESGSPPLPVTGLGIAVRCIAVARGASFVERWNACVAAARGPLLTMGFAGDRWRPDALALLRAELTAHPEASIAVAAEGFAHRPPSRFEPAACALLALPSAVSRTTSAASIGLHPMWRAEHFGSAALRQDDGPAALAAHWLRHARASTMLRLPVLLTISDLDGNQLRECDPDANPAAAAAVRAQFGLATTARLSLAKLPATLLAPGLREEASSQARFGLIDGTQLRDLINLESCHGTALLHGDTQTAVHLLRAAIAFCPQLLSPRLVLADLLTTLGLPGARAVLQDAEAADPWPRLLQQRLAMIAAADAHAAEEVACPG